MKSLKIARSCRVLAVDIKILRISVQVTLGMRLKVPIMAAFWAIFDTFQAARFGTILSLGHWFVYENLVQNMYFHMETFSNGNRSLASS